MKNWLYSVGACGTLALSATACSDDDGNAPAPEPGKTDPVGSPLGPAGGAGGSEGAGEAEREVPGAGASGASAGSSDGGTSDAEGMPGEVTDSGTSDSGASANTAGGATQPGAGEPCDVANAPIVLPDGGFCSLSEEQQVTFGLIGDFDTASCNAGRVTLGFLSAGRITLNDVEISCEPG